jgi:drug/metabolite transporter (DMT)-like permease
VNGICIATNNDTDHRTASSDCTARVLIIGLDWLSRTPFIRFVPKRGVAQGPMRLEPQSVLSMPAAGAAGAWAEPARRARAGLWLGLLGMLIFAGTIPMTRLASGSNEAPQLPPVFVAIGRAGVAGLLSVVYLLLTRAPWPRRSHWPMLAMSALGNVLGWPLLLGFAVRRVDAMHASVITGLMPLATAAVGALMLHQRPSRGFWAFALLGAALVVAFAAWSGAGRPQVGDLLLLGAVIASSIGYICGARVSSGPQGLSAEQTISWVLVLALPATLPVLVGQWPTVPVHPAAWAGFAYVATFSMWMGFFAWYRGMAWGGALRVSQVQLLQPFVSILLSAAVLGERLRPATLGFAVAVMACVWLGRRMAAGAPRAGT